MTLKRRAFARYAIAQWGFDMLVHHASTDFARDPCSSLKEEEEADSVPSAGLVMFCPKRFLRLLSEHGVKCTAGATWVWHDRRELSQLSCIMKQGERAQDFPGYLL